MYAPPEKSVSFNRKPVTEFVKMGQNSDSPLSICCRPTAARCIRIGIDPVRARLRRSGAPTVCRHFRSQSAPRTCSRKGTETVVLRANRCIFVALEEHTFTIRTHIFLASGWPLSPWNILPCVSRCAVAFRRDNKWWRSTTSCLV